MCFKRLVLNICSLSVALNENGKLLNLVETAWLRLSNMNSRVNVTMNKLKIKYSSRGAYRKKRSTQR